MTYLEEQRFESKTETTEEQPSHGNRKQKKPEKILSKNMAWMYIVIGGMLEVVWASGFKYEAVSPIIVIISIFISFDLIIKATKVIPVGTTYAVFAGIGTVGTVIVEAVASGGAISVPKIIIVLCLLLFIVGLKLSADKGAH
ncbi:MAG: hypothetical protein K0R67_3415 [Paenibacillus sp.]|nr:hypothetical protein [Paenibacillus sp.]